MTQVHVGDGRSYTLDNPAQYPNVGDLARAVADDAYDTGSDGIFSFKVDGVVIHPDTRTGQVAFDDSRTVELVDVSGYDWPTVVLEETVSEAIVVVDEDDDED